MGFLAVVGIISVVLAVAAALWFLIRLIGIRRKNRDKLSAESIRALPVIPAGRDPHEKERSQWLSRFFAAYGRLFEKLDIPAEVFTVVKCCCVFSLEHVPVAHYAWLGKDALYFFPQWESLHEYLMDPAYLHVHGNGEEELLFGWKIPAQYLESYVVDEENGITTAHYIDKKGKGHRTVFLEGGDVFFREKFPLRDSVVLERQAYLGSADNINDMKAEMRALEEQLARGEIADAVYERAKEHIMRRL